MKRKSNLLIGIALLSALAIRLDFAPAEIQKRIPLHFVAGINGHLVLSNMDRLLANHRLIQTFSSHFSPAHFSTDVATEIVETSISGEKPNDQLKAIHPKLADLWNNTAMVFGASADGIGVGTTFAIGQPTRDSAFFVTNFHVIEPFCPVPHDVVTDRVPPDDFKYECQSLFVLHDVAINTLTNDTLIEGDHPWKSEVASLLFFDRKLDLAVFKIALPPDFELQLSELETEYDLKKPELDKKEAQLREKDPASDQAPAGKIPLEAFDLYVISYSIPNTKEAKDGQGLIRKGWHQGFSDGIRSFETDERLGLISAIKHDIAIQPGSSGSPLALSDGRIIGVNASLEMNQFYGSSGCSRKLETYLSYYAIPTIFLKGVLHE